jgi:hypothetical protein
MLKIMPFFAFDYKLISTFILLKKEIRNTIKKIEKLTKTTNISNNGIFEIFFRKNPFITVLQCIIALRTI